jgi:hypothetical protein
MEQALKHQAVDATAGSCADDWAWQPENAGCSSPSVGKPDS